MRGLLVVAGITVCILSAWSQEATLPDIAPKAGWDSLAPITVPASDWPWWRGPKLDNVSPAGKPPPKAWSADANIVWRAKLSGSGHSSPILCGDRIFLTSGEKTKTEAMIWLFCLDRATGRTVWQTELYKGPPPKMHPDNSVASATPACDGSRVIVPLQTASSVEAVAVGMDGKLLWKRTIAPYNTIQGFSASPTFYKSAVLIPVEGPKGCYLTALHRESGEVVWRQPLSNAVESYSPAAVFRVSGRDQLLMIGGTSTRGYDPENGALLWECQGPARTCVATAVTDGETVFATGGYPGRQLIAVRGDGHGDVTSSHVAWRADAKVGYVPSPVYHEGVLYAVADQGLFRAYDAKTGSVLWEQELKAPFYSSPVIADGSLYLFDRKGTGYVLPLGRTAGAPVTNTLPSGVFASPVILDGRIYLRTLGDFFCLGEK